jgi:biotin-dependent carboxylase-like uncharacterized protein
VLEVLRAGPLTTVQDLGRPGYASLGVPRSGALDRPALRLANRLVGNPESRAGLEITVSGCVLRAHSPVVLAVTGGYASIAVDGRPAGYGVAVPVPRDSTVHIGPVRYGVRTYLGVGGGIAVPDVLGSRSTDTLSGIGPDPLRDRDLLPLGEPAGHPSTVDFCPVSPAPSTVELRVRLGPRADMFTPAAVAGFCGTPYKMSVLSNRVGARLAGPTLARADATELPPEGLVLGAVQVPAGGQPLVFLADHPATGGYPVIAVVHPVDLSALAQARPGTTVVFCGPQR